MGRRGVGGHGTPAHGTSGQSQGQRSSGERPYRGYDSGSYDNSGYDSGSYASGSHASGSYESGAGAPMAQPGPAARQDPQQARNRQESWESLSSSGQSFPAQPSPPRPATPRSSAAQSSVPPAPPARQRSGRPGKKPGRGATYSVVVMTVASLFGVAVLAAQAAATAPQVSNNTKQAGKTTPRPSVNASAGSSQSSAPNPNALPANSGTGARIVYGEAAKRVWLVGSGESVVRTFAVVPGTVTAPTGNYSVTNRLAAVTGTDGTPVQYVVLFAKAQVDGSNTAFGFDAVANVTGMPPAPNSRTGGVRMAQADAQALWNFSSLGTKVVVLP